MLQERTSEDKEDAAQPDLSRFRAFFSSFGSLSSRIEAEKGDEEERVTKKARRFFSEFSELRREAHESGADFNIWRIAGLTDKESPPTRILAWFLDGRQPHGMGAVFMRALLSIVPDRYWSGGRRPEDIDRDYAVRMEISFRNEDFMDAETGTMHSRPDLLIKSKDFLLVIEAKTRTSEHDGQLSRYAMIAERLAPDRPWALVYLTPRGGRSRDYGNACPMAWSSVAAVFRDALKKAGQLTPAAIVCGHFCEYIESL